MTLMELCVRHTAETVRKNKGSRTAAAQQLGIAVRTVRSYLHRYADAYPSEVCRYTSINGLNVLEKKIENTKKRLEYQIRKAELERQRLLDLQDKHQARKYKVKGA